MERKDKKMSSARQILRRTFFDGHPERLQELEQTRREMALGMKIRRLREEAGLTQEQLAKQINTQPSAISRIEDADYDSHSMSLLKRVADALGMLLIIDFVEKPTPDRNKAKME